MKSIYTDVLILGSGPGGYTAAFRCSDLGFKTILLEKNNNGLGGVCLNYGCIPSKSLLYFSKIINNVKKFINFNILENVKIDSFNLYNLNTWKNIIINKLSKELNKTLKLKKVEIIYGFGKFINKNSLKLENKNIIIKFKFAIIATGSSSIKLNNVDYSINNIWDSTKALEIPFIPNSLLIIGAGIIGIEIATIYNHLGCSNIDIIEINSKILSNLDFDIVETFINITKNKFNFKTNTSLYNINNIENNSISVTLEDNISKNKYIKSYNSILYSVGRKPNTDNLNLNNINLDIDNKGFIKVDNNMMSNINNIYAIGDVIGYPMLAHKAIYEAHIASESIFNINSNYKTKIIPSIIYSDPEISYVGINENYAIDNKINYKTSKFKWNSLGQAIISDSNYGFTKLIFNKNDNILIGGSIIGYNCGEILGEISLAIEMCCNSEDISSIIHAHPSIYESIYLSSEIINILNFSKNKK